MKGLWYHCSHSYLVCFEGAKVFTWNLLSVSGTVYRSSSILSSSRAIFCLFLSFKVDFWYVDHGKYGNDVHENNRSENIEWWKSKLIYESVGSLFWGFGGATLICGRGSIFQFSILQTKFLHDILQSFVLLQHLLVVRPTFMVVSAVVQFFGHQNEELVGSSIFMSLEFILMQNQKLGIGVIFLFGPFLILFFPQLGMPHRPGHGELWLLITSNIFLDLFLFYHEQYLL